MPTPAGVLLSLGQAYGENQVGALDDDLTRCFKLSKKDNDADQKFDLTYGEMLPHGVSKLLSKERIIPGPRAKLLLDLGMGAGKVAMQAFLEKRQLAHVVGVELAHARYEIAAQALKNMAARKPGKLGCWEEPRMNDQSMKCLRLVEEHRILDFYHGDIFELEPDLISKADAIIMAVAFPKHMFDKVRALLNRAKRGCRILTYEDLHLESHACEPSASRSFHPLQCNKDSGDCYPVSWIPDPGHHFYLHEVGAIGVV